MRLKRGPSIAAGRAHFRIRPCSAFDVGQAQAGRSNFSLSAAVTRSLLAEASFSAAPWFGRYRGEADMALRFIECDAVIWSLSGELRTLHGHLESVVPDPSQLFAARFLCNARRRALQIVKCPSHGAITIPLHAGGRPASPMPGF